MSELHVLRVFVNEDGEWGNPLGVFLDGGEIPEDARQRIAAELGFSETVFVEDRESGRMRIFTPAVELPFAGHPTVGAAWLLRRASAEKPAPGTGNRGGPVDVLRVPAGDVGVREDGPDVYVSASPEWAPGFEYFELGSPAEVRALEGPPPGIGAAYMWAWIDEAAGTIRARSFAPEAGIAEDEATGSAAIALCAQIGQPVTIHQGHGSVLSVRPLPDGRVEVGGGVRLDEVRDFPITVPG